VLLIGIWWLDVYLKRIYEYYNTTAFADLSFACVVFAGSQGIAWVRGADIHDLSTNSVAQIVTITIMLVILWLGNLSVCRGLFGNSRNAQVLYRTRLIWAVSFLFAALSVGGAIYILIKV